MIYWKKKTKSYCKKKKLSMNNNNKYWIYKINMKIKLSN